jgi:hypothetical protein
MNGMIEKLKIKLLLIVTEGVKVVTEVKVMGGPQSVPIDQLFTSL